MRLLSDASEYGLRAIVWLSGQPEGPYKLRTIAEATGSAPGYLIKVLQALAKSGIVLAHRGTTGGFALNRDPKSLTVLEVISAIDPIERIRSCPLGLPQHTLALCPLHRRIDDALAKIEREFASTAIAELAQESAQAEQVCNVLASGGRCSPGCGP